MNAPLPADLCELPCQWRDTDLCIRHVLNDQKLHVEYVGLGLYYGLKHLYHPHDPPPCVHCNEAINWHHAEANEESELIRTTSVASS